MLLTSSLCIVYELQTPLRISPHLVILMAKSKPAGLGIQRERMAFASQHDKERLCGHNQFTRRVHGIHTILAHGDTADWSRRWQSTLSQVTWSFG
ncbi:hypothetical protein BaRGS_00033201 [Batillaria attramentaria]|uniref:Uncharacterized protein n=1 Tax=Batillaria attramentaria TaxID=370345 RepID=A0ABD0JKQ9_9CAEN